MQQIGHKIGLHESLNNINPMEMKIIMDKESLKGIHLNDNSEKLEVEVDCDVRNWEYEVIDPPDSIIDREFEEEGLVMEETVHFEGEDVEGEKVFEEAGGDWGQEDKDEEGGG